MNFNLIVEVFGDTRENVGLNTTSVAPAVVPLRPRARGPEPKPETRGGSRARCERAYVTLIPGSGWGYGYGRVSAPGCAASN